MQANAILSIGLDERLASLTRLLRACPARRDGRPMHCVLAVSGGPDSLSMLALIGAARSALAEAGFAFSVATVDHGLRAAAALEAARVGAVARDYRFEHVVLRWRDWTGVGNLQAAAREARYALLAEAARARGATAILTAHTLDDQIETVLMARARGAGGTALAGMRARRDLAPGLSLVRPFLHLRKADLGSVLRPHRLVAAQDPSNDDPRFARVRARHAAALLTHEERDDILAAIEAAQALRTAEDAAFRDAVWSAPDGPIPACDAFGRLSFDQDRVFSLPPAMAARLVSRALTAAGGAPCPAASAATTRLEHRLRAAADGLAATLNGCRVQSRGGRIVFSREYGRTGPAPVAADGPHQIFDGRFDIAVPEGAGTGRRLVPLGLFGRGNEAERTLPVLMADAGGIVAAHAAIAGKVGVEGRNLTAVSRVEWRFSSDLADPRTPARSSRNPADEGVEQGGRTASKRERVVSVNRLHPNCRKRT